MAEKSGVSWTHHSLNLWIGCQKVSEGCAQCYAWRDFDLRRHFAKWGSAGVGTRVKTQRWDQVWKWNAAAEAAGERRRVFINPDSDFFEDWTGSILSSKKVTDEPELDSDGLFGGIRVSTPWNPVLWVCPGRGVVHAGELPMNSTDHRLATMDDLRSEAFALFDQCEWLDFLLVTKRPENIQRKWHATCQPGPSRYRPNVWLLTSCENQEWASERVPELLACRDLVPVLGVSCEPLLSEIHLCMHLMQGSHLDWVIAGGLSAADDKRVEMPLAAMESLHRQCAEAEVAFFCKQDSARVAGQQGRIPDEVWNTKQFPLVGDR